MKLIPTEIPELVIIEPTIFHDNRGWFTESFNEQRFHQELAKCNLPIPPSFVQDNHSCSNKQVLRGLHYQLPPHGQGKLIRVVKGACFDVAVDMREGSPTFGRHVSVALSAENQRMFWIPEGFAHAFLTLEEDTHFLYKATDFYHKDCEASVRWDDPDIGIPWPLKEPPILNQKDEAAPFLKDAVKMPYEKKELREQGLIDLPVIGDLRGSLIALENQTHLPFRIERVYYIYDTRKNVSRGYHAHKNLKQLAVCVSGRCCITLDDSVKRETYCLDTPSKGLLIPAMMWREMHDFSEDCVLVVFASERYEEADYIHDYSTFVYETSKRYSEQ